MRYVNNAATVISGEAAEWDPGDPVKAQAFRELAGGQFLAVVDGGQVALVLTEDGREMRVYPGMWARSTDGRDGVAFASAGNFGSPGGLFTLTLGG